MHQPSRCDDFCAHEFRVEDNSQVKSGSYLTRLNRADDLAQIRGRFWSDRPPSCEPSLKVKTEHSRTSSADGLKEDFGCEKRRIGRSTGSRGEPQVSQRKQEAWITGKKELQWRRFSSTMGVGRTSTKGLNKEVARSPVWIDPRMGHHGGERAAKVLVGLNVPIYPTRSSKIDIPVAHRHVHNLKTLYGMTNRR